jgi:hypothetical protein
MNHHQIAAASGRYHVRISDVHQARIAKSRAPCCADRSAMRTQRTRRTAATFAERRATLRQSSGFKAGLRGAKARYIHRAMGDVATAVRLESRTSLCEGTLPSPSEGRL